MKPLHRRNQGSRHASVVEFSREHHHGLVFCIRMKRLLDRGVSLEFVKMLFRSFWEQDLSGHTQREAAWAQTLPESKELSRMLSDHDELESSFSRLDSMGRAELHQLADRLQAHIRFEEHVLFPLAGL